MTNVKVTVVGDGVVGKTCMLSTYVNNSFPGVYVPTVFDQFCKDISFEGKTYNVSLWDTAGQEDYERLRPLSYPNTSCFLVCFTVDKNSASYDNVCTKWVPEIKHFNPLTPFILVATKIDLRQDPSVLCYSTNDGYKLKKKVKANSYVESSAKDQQGLDDIFSEVLRVFQSSNSNRTKTRKQSKCNML